MSLYWNKSWVPPGRLRCRTAGQVSFSTCWTRLLQDTVIRCETVKLCETQCETRTRRKYMAKWCVSSALPFTGFTMLLTKLFPALQTNHSRVNHSLQRLTNHLRQSDTSRQGCHVGFLLASGDFCEFCCNCSHLSLFPIVRIYCCQWIDLMHRVRNKATPFCVTATCVTPKRLCLMQMAWSRRWYNLKFNENKRDKNHWIHRKFGKWSWTHWNLLRIILSLH